MPHAVPRSRLHTAITALVCALIGSCLLLGEIGLPRAPVAHARPEAALANHLVISEVQTGGAAASDEFIEL
ncbi:MAG: hypothetical protein HY023_11265, partial [Chloroflexi bacterium]|nr:hypothetical protein [Chloroflexota bacterium]